MRKWSFLFFVLAFMHPASALADDGADKKKLGPFYYTVSHDYSREKWDVGVLNQQDKTNIPETDLNDETLKLFQRTVDDLADLAIRFAAMSVLLVCSLVVFTYFRIQKKRPFLRLFFVFSSVGFLFCVYTSLELFKKTEQAKSLFYLL
ncbi:hypothetical protein [Priestia sp. TSO9]|uniref:hypothetical protein n=1 Tax=Priestia TaxID=2800373 RepID=UPI001E566127|nr:hypothetical protein [Priestia sp. TSO9]